MSDYQAPGNFMLRAFQALSSMQQTLTDVYVHDGELTQDALDITDKIMKETNDKLTADQQDLSNFIRDHKDDQQGITDRQTKYQTDQAKWKNYYTEAQSNLNIPQDSAQRASSNMANFQQFLAQLMDIMRNLNTALGSGG